MNELVFSELKKEFPFVENRESKDCLSVNIPANEVVDFFTRIKTNYDFDLLSNIAGVDWGASTVPRFGAFYHLYATHHHQYLRVYTACEGKECSIASIVSIFPSANWHEREVFDMFGISFSGHPNLKRILMWEEYPYHPLRKDFPLCGKEAPYFAPDIVAETKLNVTPAPMCGGPFHAIYKGSIRHSEPTGFDEN
ncbi:MAG: hypothetical protein A2007_01605 [Verrucomicrobia bacterium GWC2_42_7]|nr:MAG: hypothetical protein A2007_01605 [Verrucomicrobia bacterium GWC2_42_7]